MLDAGSEAAPILSSSKRCAFAKGAERGRGQHARRESEQCTRPSHSLVLHSAFPAVTKCFARDPLKHAHTFDPKRQGMAHVEADVPIRSKLDTEIT
jgi:hypothetical protein